MPTGRRLRGGRFGVDVGEVAGEFAVGVDLGEEIMRLLFEGRVGAGREPQPRLAETGELEECVGELGGVAALWPFMAFQASTVAVVRWA